MDDTIAASSNLLRKGERVMKQICAATKNMMGMRMCTMCMICRANFSDALSPIPAAVRR